MVTSWWWIQQNVTIWAMGFGREEQRQKKIENVQQHREEIMFDQIAVLELRWNWWSAAIRRLITPSPGNVINKDLLSKYFFICLKTNLPSLEIRGMEQRGKATCSSAFKQSAVERTRQVGWKRHTSPEAPQISGKKTIPVSRPTAHKATLSSSGY